MKRFLKSLRKLCIAQGVLLAAASLGSCTMIEDKLDDCPSGLFVRFTYDYNTVRADLFNDHVGHVQLYVYDESGRLAATRSVSNIPGDSPLASPLYVMHFEEKELPAGHSYRLQAVAMQRDWDESLKTQGAKYRFTGNPSDNAQALEITLDHTAMPGSEAYAVSDAAPLDTLWHTLKVTPHLPQDGISAPEIDKTTKPFGIYPQEEQLVRVESGKATYATVSLIRDTNHLSLTLHQTSEPDNMFADRYDVRIIDRNAAVTHDNTVLTDRTLHYTPYASWTTCQRADGTVEIESVHKGTLASKASTNTTNTTKTTRAEGSDVVERIGHYNLMFNRLMLNDATADNAALQIVNKEDGKTVAEINLPHFLAIGREAYAQRNYGSQEYLDREYDYHLNLFLRGEKWVSVEVAVLSWAKRIQNVEL